MAAFEFRRSTTIAAAPTVVHALIDDFHEWERWSPWEDVDPDLRRAYSGADSGVGARYEWQGNRKAGEGSMEITGSSPERIAIDLRFLKPFKADNDIEFVLQPVGDGTQVDWVMRGNNTGLAALFAKVMPTEKLVGKDFEKGLARLKSAAESGPTA
ncbi:SRPBCC family protein [Knoellia sp. CPCC 206450]|uniref:SRPBCC family protein n=1 Tax=Knoellia tibetensis TaxID=3404798 RepID=UPI003B434010